MALPQTGAALGIDIGTSVLRRSSAVCRLDWDAGSLRWTIRRFRAVALEQQQVIGVVAGDVPLLAAAFDGPLRAGLTVIGRYRVAERMLTRRLQSRIGKPGQASAPIGRSLNQAANDCARIVLARGTTAPASHATVIDTHAIAEAFPSAFLGLMLADPAAVPAVRANRSDVFFRHLADDGTLQALLAHLLPGRSAPAFDQVTNHDDRAALVCALTALCVAARDYTAVGDADGWIILPPPGFVRSWAWPDLEANAAAEAPGCLFRSDR